ncbi:MAG: histidinol-phosphatase [Eubacteriales Family XIII. Incertae Sedis bacterium]|nr:MAG: histidinol-phosphatase [Clostridiales Family XIII bacterium]PWM67180.1 MAG: histidinol-phosphatase [Clostridiales Family XIII bacterium]
MEKTTMSNYHTHTVYCDGNDTPEALVLEAIRLGCPSIGFSGHSFTEFDQSYCMSREKTEEYKREVRALKEKYRGQIEILLGVEQDYYSEEPTDEYDYVIGSVHYILKDGVYLTVDWTREQQEEDVKIYYGGDFYAYAEDYYKIVADIYRKTKCDIVGHFDLITKFNQDDALFDTKDERYRNAALAAVRALLKTPAAFEINTGAIARGLRTEPYPAKFILDEIYREGGEVLITSDCHAKENLLFGFDCV